jgi:hypothetical protein
MEALWVANLGQSQSEKKARFIGGTVSWEVPSLVEPRHSGAARVEMSLASNDGWSLWVGYAARVAPDSRDHAFRLGGKLSF